MKILKSIKVTNEYGFDGRIKFKTIHSQTSTGILTCLYITEFNGIDLELIGANGGIMVMHDWSKYDYDTWYDHASAIIDEKIVKTDDGSITAVRFNLINDQCLTLTRYINDTFTEWFEITCLTHVIGITMLGETALSVIIMDGNKTVLHKIVKNYGTAMINNM